MTRAKKILSLRKKQGLSQEELADRASINLRTLQRIEQGQTEPRGQTLRLLAEALGHSPEDLLCPKTTIELKADLTFLQLLNLSALSLWLLPFGNLILPAVLWWKYRDTIAGVQTLGRSLLRFQLWWSGLCYGILLLVIASAAAHPVGMSPLLPAYLMAGIGLLYLLNTLLIILASLQLRHGNMPFYTKPFKRSPDLLKMAVLCVLMTGFNAPTLAQKKESPKAPGQLIDIGGWRLHLYGQGMQHTQGPSIILEAGIGAFSFDWTLVQSEVATFARVYSYDRAGYAWSDLGPRPHTMQQAVYELHTLLQKAQVPRPYVLVGAFYGGVLVRLFTHQYPDEVAGLVLVDAGHENGRYFINGRMQSPEKDAKGIPVPSVKTVATNEDNNLAKTPEAIKAIGDALKKMNLPPDRLSLPYTQLPDSIQQIRLWALGNYEYYAASDNPVLMEELLGLIKTRSANPQILGSKPLVVITRGKAYDNDTETDEIKRRQDQKNLLQLSANSKQIMADLSAHHIPLDQPYLITKAIKDIVEMIRK